MPDGTYDVHDIRHDTALSATRRFRAVSTRLIPDAWKVVYVFGGVSMYAALRAMTRSRSAATISRSSPRMPSSSRRYRPATITIDVDVLRDGRRASQVAADLRVPGVDGPALRVHGVFGAPHDTELGVPRRAVPRGLAPGRIRRCRPTTRAGRTRSGRSTSTSRPSGDR